MTLSPAQLEHAAELMAGADALVIAAGAGIGVDSGLPDFRGKDGFWKAYPAPRAMGPGSRACPTPATLPSRASKRRAS